MRTEITVLVESEILPGQAEALREVVGRVIEHCGETEPGLLAYEWYVDEAASEARVVERYADSDALLFHFQNYARFGEELAACRKMKKLTLLGEPSEALQKALEAMSPPVFRPSIRLER